VTGLTWSEAVAVGLTPFLVWDAAKLTIAAVAFPAAWWMIGRRPEDR
jgi:biotin transporter BioY